MRERLRGFWRLTTLETNCDGEVQKEMVLGGLAAFDDGHVVYFSRTNEIAMGFAAQYDLEGEKITLRCEAATFPEIEQSLLVRQITRLTDGELELSGVEIGTHRKVRLGFRRVGGRVS